MRNNINYIISEEINKFINNLLTEDDSSKSIKAAKKLCANNKMVGDIDDFVRITMRKYIPSLHGLGDKFILGCTRLYWEGTINDEESKGFLAQIVNYICDNEEYYNTFDRNLNQLSFDELVNIFKPLIHNQLNIDKALLNGQNFINNNYDIVSINSFEEANQYKKYTCQENPWCISSLETSYDSYSNNGANQIYFCLKDGFENIDMPEETGNYKDDYGLSMISVIVNPDGSLAYATTRWNHKNGANGEHDLTTQEISRIVGVNFYETFKPNTIFQDKLSNCLNKIKQGYLPEDVFDDAYDFQDGLAAVRLNRQWNWITIDGHILSNKWFDLVGDFNDGWAQVQLNFTYNLVNKNGKLLSKKWFDIIENFYDGWARVGLNGKWGLISENGHLLRNKLFTNIAYFDGNFAMVQKNNQYNYIDKSGNYLSPNQWFDELSQFRQSGVAAVRIGDMYNFIDTKGHLCSKWEPL